MSLWQVREKLQVKIDIASSVSQTSDYVLGQQSARGEIL
jgi:hypothetical protein